MQRIYGTLLALALVLTPGLGAAALRVVTTTTDLAAIARAVGGEDVSVESLTIGPRDPHYAAAKPSMIRRVFRADLLLLVGADLEIGWLPAALQAGRNRRVLPGQPGYLDLSGAVTLIEKPTGPVSRAMGDVHVKGNPHYLLDPRNGVLVARAIAARLERLDPARGSVYRARLAAFERRLERKIPDWQARLAGLGGKDVIAYHRTFSYFANAFGFRIVGQVEPLPGIAPTARHLGALIGRIQTEKIGVLIMAAYYERRSARFLADRTGIRVVPLPQAVAAEPEIRTYEDLFDTIVRRLASAGAG